MPFETIVIAPQRNAKRARYLPGSLPPEHRGRVLDALHRAEAGVRLRSVMSAMQLGPNDVEESESSVVHDQTGDLVAYIWCDTESERARVRELIAKLYPDAPGLDRVLRDTAAAFGR